MGKGDIGGVERRNGKGKENYILIKIKLKPQ